MPVPYSLLLQVFANRRHSGFSDRMCRRRPVSSAYRVFGGYGLPSFLRVSAQYSDSHFESNEGSELSRRTCLAWSPSNFLFRLVCQARKFVTAHLVIVAVFFGTHFFAKLSSSASFRKLHRELGAFSFSLVAQGSWVISGLGFLSDKHSRFFLAPESRRPLHCRSSRLRDLGGIAFVLH